MSVLVLQFWAAYVPCATQYKDAVRQTLEQIDTIHRMCLKYPGEFMFAASSQGNVKFPSQALIHCFCILSVNELEVCFVYCTVPL